MFISRIDPEQLQTKRLDADFYQPNYIAVEAKLLAHSVCPLGEIGKFFAGPFGSALPSNLYLEEGIPLFRVSNVGQFEVITDNFAHLAESVHEELKVSEVRPGDLLIVKASVGEKICKVPDWIEKANITQHIIGVRPNGKFDIDYVSAFLFSRYGVLQFQRYALGSIIQYLGITDAKSAWLLQATPTVQKYIGDKVRQAERLRTWSKKLDVKLKSEILKVFAGKQKPLREHKTFVSVATLNSNRMEAEYYAPVALWAENEITKSPYGHSSLGDLTTRIKDGPGGWGVSTNDYVSSGVPVIRSVNIMDGECDLSGCIYITESKHQELIAHAAKKGSVVLSVRGSVGRAAVFNDDVFMQANLNAAVVTIDCKPTINPYYLAAFLNSEIGKIQSGRIANGAVQQNMNLTETASNLIVVPPMTLQSEIATIYQSFLDTKKFSKKLTNAAKFLVEGLIEGLVTEAELIAAQQGLEAGDTEADAAILRRLKTDGLDGKGQPLFGDVERVYELLGQVNLERE